MIDISSLLANAMGSGGGMSAAGSSMGGFLGNMLGKSGGKDPSDAANAYLQQIEGGMGKYLNPYSDAGHRSISVLENQANRNINDPTSVMNQIGAGFRKSPGFDWAASQMEGAANRANAAGGMLGSPAHQQAIAQSINGLANQDYYNYMDRGLQQYNNAGLGSMNNLYSGGLNASTSMANGLLQQLMAQAENAYAGAANKNQQKGSMMGGIGSLAGGVLGGMFGGPVGAMGGSALGGAVGGMLG
jgi:hypothetical protein